MVVESHENTLAVGFWVWRIHFWGYFLDSAILRNSRWPPPKIQKWDDLRSIVGRIIWKYTFEGFWGWWIHFWGYFLDLAIWDNFRSNGGRITWKIHFCGFLTVRNAFYWYFFGFGHIGQIQDGHHPKYKFGIIWDLIEVESHENILFVGFWMWGIHIWDCFLYSAILEKFKMATTQNKLVG